jgi:hypothetical protein
LHSHKPKSDTASYTRFIQVETQNNQGQDFKTRPECCEIKKLKLPGVFEQKQKLCVTKNNSFVLIMYLKNKNFNQITA